MTLIAVIRWIAIVAIAGYAAIVLLVFLQQGAMLYPGARSEVVTGSPAPWGRWQSLKAIDGTDLAALYAPARSGRPTVLMFLGNGDDIRAYDFMAEALQARGIGLLTASYRGYPGSGGSPTEAGILSDALVIYDWLAGQTSDIALVGRSLGTGVAVNTAANRTVKSLVLVSPYDSIASVAADRFPWLPVRLLIRDSYRSDQRIAAVKAPTLFLHGDEDDSIPIEHGRALFRQASEPKNFVTLSGVGHNDVWSELTVSHIVDFIEQN